MAEDATSGTESVRLQQADRLQEFVETSLAVYDALSGRAGTDPDG